MKKPIKILLIVGIVLTLIGGVITAVGFASSKEFPYLYWGEEGRVIQYHSEDLGTSEQITIDAFSKIDIATEMGAVEIMEGDHFSIQYINYPKDSLPTYEVKDGTLSLQYAISLKGTVMFGEGVSASPKITVTVPQGTALSSVNVSADEDITVTNLTVDNLILYSDYSNEVDLQDVNADNSEIHVGSGSLLLKSCVLGESSLWAEYGDMEIIDCQGSAPWSIDAESGNMEIKNSQLETVTCKVGYGDATMENIMSQGLDLSMESGNAQISGDLRGNTKIYAEYGGLLLNLVGTEGEYGYEIEAEYGSITVNGQTIEGTMRSKNDTPDQIEIISESGDVELSFRQES